MAYKVEEVKSTDENIASALQAKLNKLTINTLHEVVIVYGEPDSQMVSPTGRVKALIIYS